MEVTFRTSLAVRCDGIVPPELEEKLKPLLQKNGYLLGIDPREVTLVPKAGVTEAQLIPRVKRALGELGLVITN